MFYTLYNYITKKYASEFSPVSDARMREALIFKKTAEFIPVEIRPGDLIAGWYGYNEPPSDAETVNKLPPPAPLAPYPSKAESAVTARELGKYNITASFGAGHTCLNYGTVIGRGLEYYIGMISESVSGGKSEDNISAEAMITSLNSAGIYAGRYASLAGKLAAEAETEEDRTRLERIRRACLRVPMKPARDFFEAVQSVWLMHSLSPIADNNWASISLGRLDQYLYSYYDAADKDNCFEILKNLFLLLNSYGDGACALNIGGLSPDGDDQMNGLSEMIIDVEKAVASCSPILAARVSEKTPDRIMRMLVDKKLFEIGQPTFYGEESCRRSVETRGIAASEAARFSANSCMGLAVAGSEIADMWGCKFNSHLPLELAVNGGRPLSGNLELDLKIQPRGDYDSIDGVIVQYGLYFGELLGLALNLNRESAERTAALRPNPFLSAITEDCPESGKDRAVGARYENVTVETMGLVNTVNALLAIDSLIFKNKKYALSDLVSAARANYAGYEPLRRDILGAEKFGMNTHRSNGFADRIVGMIADICRSRNFGNTRYLLSLHTIDVNVGYGKGLYATLDGRLSGAPVAKNANMSGETQPVSPTEMALSAASAGLYRFSGGQPIDLYFGRGSFSTPDGADKIIALIRTFHRLGGMQLQVNCVDTETLKKVYENPEDYKQLIVRIGGYSRRFYEMGSDEKLEFIKRSQPAF